MPDLHLPPGASQIGQCSNYRIISSLGPFCKSARTARKISRLPPHPIFFLQNSPTWEVPWGPQWTLRYVHIKLNINRAREKGRTVHFFGSDSPKSRTTVTDSAIAIPIAIGKLFGLRPRPKIDLAFHVPWGLDVREDGDEPHGDRQGAELLIRLPDYPYS